MEISTATVQRLRDALLEGGRLPAEPGSDSPGQDNEQVRRAAEERFTPFAETMYLMMMADQEEDRAEHDAIRGAMRILTDGLLSDDVLQDILNRCSRDASQYGAESCLQAIGTRLSADKLDRETAFTLAAAIALADNKVQDSESALMQTIAEWYGISGRRAAALLEQV